jgi:hypothetical protein
VSNDDRERVAQVLNTAMAEGRLTVNELEERLDKVYTAKTFGDLEPLLRDLPVGNQIMRFPLAPPPAGSAPAPLPAPSHRIGGRGTSTGAVAIMSGTDRKGIWTVPPTFTSFALMGGIDIYVPDDITVQVNGVGFMGAFENHARNQGQPIPGAPLVKITGLAVWGGVDVKHRKKKRTELEE